MARLRFAMLFAVASILISAVEIRGASERLITVEGHPPVRSVEIGELTDTNGKGKKFVGSGTLVLADERRFVLGVKQRYNAKKLKSTFTLSSPKKTTPKIKVTVKTIDDPEQLKLVKLLFKDIDGTKTKVREKVGSVIVAIEPVDPVLSSQLALRGVRSLIDGEDTFDDTVQLFDDAVDADSRNRQPVFFRALARLLATARATAVAPGGTLHSLHNRAGILDPVGVGFWNLRWGAEEEHGQGQIKDGAPRADELVAFLRSELMPALENFLTDLDSVPADFEYRLSNVDALGDPFDGDPADDLETVWIDVGDVEFLRSMAHVLLAAAAVTDAYDWNDLDPNHFDRIDNAGVDLFARIETVYPRLGTLSRPAQLTSARSHLALARAAYDRGAAFLLAESEEQSDNGLFTPIRDAFRGESPFATPEARDTFVASEAGFKAWLSGLVDSFELDLPYTIATRRDGTAIEVGRRYTLNVFQFLDQSTGVDFRALYFKLITDPVTNRRVLGVASLDEITQAMRTADGAIVKARDVEPNRGDLMSGLSGLYALRIDAPPVHEKTIDGDLSEWSFGTNSVQVFEGPRVRYDSPRTDWGDLYLARGTTDLFLGLDGDRAEYSWLEIEIRSAGGSAFADAFFGGFGDVEDPDVAVGTGGIEFAFPLSNFGASSWVTLRLRGQNHSGEQVVAGPIHVRID